MKKLFTTPFLFYFLSILHGSVYSQSAEKYPDYTPLIEKYREILKKEMEQFHDAGLSIALVDGDRVVWCEGFGYYNAKEKKPVTEHTQFHIGSLCKTFTGLAVMQLQEDQKLDINKPFKMYVPEFAMKSRYGSIESVTARQILTHHAGIPDYIKDKFYETKPPYFTQVLEMVNNDYATFSPGQVFSYSNTGFSILGNLIENVSGMSYYDFVKKRILDPMEMTETGFVLDTVMPESVRLGYSKEGKENKELVIFDTPAGCIYSSASDMAKYIITYLNWGKFKNHKVFESSTQSQMMQVQNSDVFLDFGFPYGLAWKIYYNDGGLSIQHDGGTMYHRAELSISPGSGLGVIMLSNSASGKPLLHADYDILNEAQKIKEIKPVQINQTLKNIRHPEHNIRFRTDSVESIKFVNKPAEELDNYQGTYGTFGMYLTIKSDSGALKINIMGNTFYLLPVENNEFIPAGANDKKTVNPYERFYFEIENNNYILIQKDQWGNHSIMAEKIEMKKISDIWMKRIGNYSKNGINKYQMFSDFQIISEPGFLLLKAKFNMEFSTGSDFMIPLKIIDDNLAVVWGYGRFSGQAIQFYKDKNNKEYMDFMGFICQLVN